MEREIVYMLGIVAVGFAVNYTLRALPFILFAGRDRELPRWVLRFGDFISPIIIAGLIFYSYSGLAWKTAWPYLAGALTVGLQLWLRNALLSIVAGTVLYMVLVAGCVTERTIEFDSTHPLITLKENGVELGGEDVSPEDVPELLEEAGVPHNATIHIAIDDKVAKDLRAARLFMYFLQKHGYTRPMLVTSRHAESSKLEGRGVSAAGAKKLPKIRYKGAAE